MEELRSRWELPATAHYIASFHRVFQFPEMHVEELETAIMTSCTEEGSDLLNRLIADLLAGCYNSKNITSYNYESSLRDFLHNKWTVEEHRSNPLVDQMFRELDLVEKLDIIFALCLHRLDAEDVNEATKGVSTDELRVVPVGSDSLNFTYWNFNDERLYKEATVEESSTKPKKKKHKKHKKGKHRNCDSEEENGSSHTSLPGERATWSLVCSTEDDWDNLVKTLKKSDHKADKKLRKIIQNDFVSLIPEIIKEKEKAMAKRFLELAPRRESSRIARRKEEMSEQKGILAQIEAEEEEEKRIIEAEKKRIADERRREEMAKEREERLRAREAERIAKEQAQQDRAMRALMREQRLAMGSDVDRTTGSDSEESEWESWDEVQPRRYNSSSGRRAARPDRRDHNAGSKSGFGPKEYEKINRILYQIQRDGNAWPFLEPVTRDIAPDYLDVITKPMDISVIRGKATRKEYTRKEQFISDFRLIVDNCVQYNGPENAYSLMAHKLQSKLETLVDRAFPANLPTHSVQPSKEIKSSSDGLGNLSDSASAADSEPSMYTSVSETPSDYEPESKRKPPSRKPTRKVNRRPSNIKNGVKKLTSNLSSSSDDSGHSNSDSESLKSPSRVFGIAKRQNSNILQTDSLTSQSFNILTGDPLSPNDSSSTNLETITSPPEESTLNPEKVHSDLTRWRVGSLKSASHIYTNKPPDIQTQLSNGEKSQNKSLPFQGLFAQLKRTVSDSLSDEPT